jgi:hypothetical protein
MSITHPLTTQKQSNNNTQLAPQKTSVLQRIPLGFEYNKTLQEIKREVRMRTI